MICRWLEGEALRDLSAWVSERIDGKPDFGDCQGLEVFSDSRIGGIIYVHYRDDDLEMNVAADSPRFLNRAVLREAFGYPFHQLGCRRVTSIVKDGNSHALNFNLRLGFQIEGRCREGFGESDAIILGMLKKECRWIHG